MLTVGVLTSNGIQCVDRTEWPTSLLVMLAAVPFVVQGNIWWTTTSNSWLQIFCHIFVFIYLLYLHMFVRHSMAVHVSRAGDWFLGTPLQCLDSVHERAAALKCSTSIWHCSLLPSLCTVWAQFPSSSSHWGSVWIVSILVPCSCSIGLFHVFSCIYCIWFSFTYCTTFNV